MKGKLSYLLFMHDTYHVISPKVKKFAYLGHRRFLPIQHHLRTSKYNSKFDGKPCMHTSKVPKN